MSDKLVCGSFKPRFDGCRPLGLAACLAADEARLLKLDLVLQGERIAQLERGEALRLARRTAELELNRRRLELIIDAVPDAVLAFDEHGLVVSLNRAARRLFGWSDHAALGEHVGRFLGDALEGDANAGTAIEREGRHRNGSPVHIEITVRTVSLDGERLRVATVKDLTEVKYTQKLLNEQAFLVEKSRSLLVFTDPRSNILWSNPQFVKTSGHTLDELVGRRLSDFLLPDETTDRSGPLMRQAVRQRKPFDVELLLRHSSGRPFYVHLNAYPMFREDGSLEKYAAIGVEITEEKRQKKLGIDFVSMVSHELRTPLTVVSAALDSLECGRFDDTPDMRAELVAMGTRNCRQLSTLIEDLLDVNKIEAGVIRLNCQQVPVVALAQEVILSMRPIATDADVRCRFVEPASELYAFVDPQRLRQVMTNLLSNAIKFSPAGGTVRVSVDAVAQAINGESSGAEPIRFAVMNRGDGIPDELRPRIFGKFARGLEVQANGKEGFGLGLCISKRLVEQMNGSIGFESEPGLETVFSINVPRADTRTEAPVPARRVDRRRNDKGASPRGLAPS